MQVTGVSYVDDVCYMQVTGVSYAGDRCVICR